MIKNKYWFLMILCLIIGVWPAHAEINGKLLKEFKLTHAPLDMEVSLSGQRVFILDDQGNLLVYSIDGRLTDTIPVGKDVDQIKVSPRDDLLFLASRENKTVRILNLIYTHDIDISGCPYQGPSNAPVAVVIFSDFQCPYCARIRSVLDQVREHFPKQVKVVYKQFPLSSHRYSLLAAKASIAADAQGKFWEYHDLLFENYSRLNEQKIEQFRAALKLDKAKFDRVMNAPQTLEKINRDRQEGEEADVRGTPTIFVNGRMVRPANYEGITEAVQNALKALGKN
jgi:protein-disulfide isomerase